MIATMMVMTMAFMVIVTAIEMLMLIFLSRPLA